MEGKRKVPKGMRLQKFLSQAGVASRREAEEWIRAGRVHIGKKGGQTRTLAEIGVSVEPDSEEVFLDGKRIQLKTTQVYYLFNKPRNVMVTRKDPEGRPTIFDYFKNMPERVNSVGRLDFDSEGLLLLTNDGELHHRLTHPSHEIPKTYRVKISPHLASGHPLPQGGEGRIVEKLSAGVDIGGYVTAPCKVRMIKDDPNECWLEMVITEGKNRQIRRMIEVVGLRVLRLTRVALGPLVLGSLPAGAWRSLLPEEINYLKKLSGL